MATATKRKLITAEEFMEMPDPEDGSQQELVRGVIITMPPPKGRHGVCCATIARLVGNVVANKRLGLVTTNDAGVILERGPDTVRGPDVAFWNKKRQPAIPEGYFEIPPDLAVEVVSPDDSHSRLQGKTREYLKNGVKLVWIVDPELRTVTCYRSQKDAVILEEDETLSGEDVLPGFSCKVSELFA